MPLKLMYITNRPDVAQIAQENGVDRVFVDMEYIGKDARQTGDTVKSHHTVDDVSGVGAVLDRSELLVRVNPITERSADFIGSQQEIDQVVEAGADIIMLPMAKTVREVEQFVRFVDGRAKTMLLLETAEATKGIEEMLRIGGIDQVHIGLNDLHLAYQKKFMFELLTDGTVERLCGTVRKFGLPYGFGGIARIGLGLLPSEYVIAEHYRLGSSAAILSRSFCNINQMQNLTEIKQVFAEGMQRIRQYESSLLRYTAEDFEANRRQTALLVEKISQKI